MKRFSKMFLLLVINLCLLTTNPTSSYADNQYYTDEQILAAQAQLIKEIGPFYTWTFQEKADFYNKYVYFNQGTRRGVPDETCLDKETVINIGKNALTTYLVDNGYDTNIEQYYIDVDFWIQCFMDQEREHELYAVAFLAKTKRKTMDIDLYITHYQIKVSPYSGEVWEIVDVKNK